MQIICFWKVIDFCLLPKTWAKIWVKNRCVCCASDALKTASKIATQKAPEANGNLTGNER